MYNIIIILKKTFEPLRLKILRIVDGKTADWFAHSSVRKYQRYQCCGSGSRYHCGANQVTHASVADPDTSVVTIRLHASIVDPGPDTSMMKIRLHAGVVEPDR